MIEGVPRFGYECPNVHPRLLLKFAHPDPIC